MTTTVEVDVDLDQFNTEDLIQELSYRVLSTQMTDDIKNLLSDYEKPNLKFPGLIDSMKFDLFKENCSKFTLDQFEEFLKHNCK